MGLRDKYQKKIEMQGFRAIELNEENVQTIFNRCLATNDTQKEDICKGYLFYSAFGYKPEDFIVFYFDRNKLRTNKQAIQYLFGQLQSFHNLNENRDMSVDEAFYNYSGKNGQIANPLC